MSFWDIAIGVSTRVRAPSFMLEIPASPFTTSSRVRLPWPLDDDGKEMIVTYLNDGDFFGEMGLFDDEDSRSAWVRAKGSCEVGEISYSRFAEISQRFPQIHLALGRQMAARLRKTTRKVGDLAFLDVTGRVARTLLDLSKEPDAMTHPDGMQIKITRQEIGRIVGCSREMVGRVLKNLEERALVSVKGKTMVVYGTR